MNGDTYNGWSNRETWALGLWIDNDEGTYLWSREIAAAAERNRYAVANALRGWFEDLEEVAPDWHRSARDDIGSLWRIDWEEIADGFLSEMLDDEEVGR